MRKPNTSPERHGRLTGPGGAQFDMALFKSFQVRERATVMFRSDFFNLFNTPIFNNPINAVSTGPSQFGKITGAADPRIIQLSLKVSF